MRSQPVTHSPRVSPLASFHLKPCGVCARGRAVVLRSSQPGPSCQPRSKASGHGPSSSASLAMNVVTVDEAKKLIAEMCSNFYTQASRIGICD